MDRAHPRSLLTSERLIIPPSTDTESFPILREEVEEAVKSPKKGKSAVVDNIPGELVYVGGEAMILLFRFKRTRKR